MKIWVEYRAKLSSSNANQRIDVIWGEFASPDEAVKFAAERATNDPELAWVHTILLRDDNGPIPHWMRDDDA